MHVIICLLGKFIFCFRERTQFLPEQCGPHAVSLFYKFYQVNRSDFFFWAIIHTSIKCFAGNLIALCMCFLWKMDFACTPHPTPLPVKVGNIILCVLLSVCFTPCFWDKISNTIWAVEMIFYMNSLYCLWGRILKGAKSPGLILW